MPNLMPQVYFEVFLNKKSGLVSWTHLYEQVSGVSDFSCTTTVFGVFCFLLQQVQVTDKYPLGSTGDKTKEKKRGM